MARRGLAGGCRNAAESVCYPSSATIGTMEAALDIAVILLLILLNGLFALSELALVSANRARLSVLAR